MLAADQPEYAGLLQGLGYQDEDQGVHRPLDQVFHGPGEEGPDSPFH